MQIGIRVRVGVGFDQPILAVRQPSDPRIGAPQRIGLRQRELIWRSRRDRPPRHFTGKTPMNGARTPNTVRRQRRITRPQIDRVLRGIQTLIRHRGKGNVDRKGIAGDIPRAGRPRDGMIGYETLSTAPPPLVSATESKTTTPCPRMGKTRVARTAIEADRECAADGECRAVKVH